MTEPNFTRNVVRDAGYIDWQTKRISFVLEKYGNDFFKGKKVLELGCFFGGISQMLHNLGADLTSVEGFPANYETCKQRYPHINFLLKDLDNNIWEFDEHYDIIIHWGLLYHLQYPVASVVHCLGHCDYFFLETLIINHSSIKLEHVPEKNIWNTDQSIHSSGTRFTAKLVEFLFRDRSFVRYDDSKLNSGYQPHYDIPEADTNAIIRRFWVVTCRPS